MRVAAIADIHGNHLALEAVLADIRAQGISEIVNLGDCFSGPLEAGKTADILMSLDAVTVRGNHDRYLIETDPAKLHVSDRFAYDQFDRRHLDWIRGLPFSAVYMDEIYLCHATPTDDNTYWQETVSPDGLVHLRRIEEIEAFADGIGQPVILCGHTHLQRMTRLRDGRLIINPGSVGAPGYDDDLPYYHKVEAGHPFASYAILERSHGGWLPEFRQVNYDFQAMADLAASNGRLEWASALATGWLR